MSRFARLIITHSNPDLDAVGFVYSARKVFGSAVPVECREPTRTELEDSAVIVGDTGLPGAEEIGYNPSLNNFDHHYSHAERSATQLFNDTYHAMRDEIVAYIDAVDTQWVTEMHPSTLKVAIAGVRVTYRGESLAVLADGCRLLQWVEESQQKPDALNGPFPDDMAGHLQAGADEMSRIEAEMAGLEQSVTASGYHLGFVTSRSPVVSLVKEQMFAQGLEIVVVHDPTRRRYAIASNQARLKGLDLRATGLSDALNVLEREHGLSAEAWGWGGHADRLGGPRPDGSRLCPDDVLAIVRAKL